MANNGRSGKRTLAKKVTSFVLYVEVSQIQAIVEATGAEKDAQVFRDLIDEALVARRRKTAQQLVLPDQPPSPQSDETLETIQTLLLKLIQQGEKARRVRGICLELLQETLAEARAGRLPTLREQGKSVQEVVNLFNGDTAEAQNFAYELAIDITDKLHAAQTDSRSATVNDDDRGGQLISEHGDPREHRDTDVA